MLTVSGVGIIAPDVDVVETKVKGGAYFNLTLITKNPYKKDRHPIKVSVYVADSCVPKARGDLVSGNAIWVRMAELIGNKSDKGHIWMTVQTRWNWVERLKSATLEQERKEDK